MKSLGRNAARNIGEGSNTQEPPTIWEQMEEAGTTRNFTKNLTIEGSSVHVRKPPANTISRARLEDLRAKQKNNKKKI